MNSIQPFKNARGDQTRESSGEDQTGVQDRGAEGKLSPWVPAAQQEQGTRKEGRFDDTQKETNDYELGIVPGSGSRRRYNRPDKHPYRNVEGRADSSQNHVTKRPLATACSFQIDDTVLVLGSPWDLHEHVADVEDGDCNVELIANQSEIFFKGV